MNMIRRATLTAAVMLMGAVLMMGRAWADVDGWGENYQQALTRARAENKMVVMDFTGSDWCPWCIKLHDEVFNTPQFKKFAAKNLILVKVDFPRAIEQSAAVKAQNEKLQEKYKIEGYPTVIVLDSNGKQIGQLGYEEGGPAPFIEKLSKLGQK